MFPVFVLVKCFFVVIVVYLKQCMSWDAREISENTIFIKRNQIKHNRVKEPMDIDSYTYSRFRVRVPFW